MEKGLGRFFDREAEWAVHEHWRPHWAQAGTITFVTFRTADSIPASVMAQWNHERYEWIRRHGIEDFQDWRDGWRKLDSKQRLDFDNHFNRLREMTLDACHGACLLRDSSMANIVASALLHFDGTRYCMGDFVIMPNHVHLLVSFSTQEDLKACSYSWMHYSARKINQRLGRVGLLWQQETFDHLVRSPEQYDKLRNYIHDNGINAGLQANEFLLRKWDG